MDKNILHSVLETINAGQTININFNEPYAELTGDYLVLQSKTGRGRGGSRILEVQSVTDSTRIISTLQVEGKDKALGTATSELFANLTVDGKVHGLEDPAEAPRAVKVRTAAVNRENKIVQKTNQKAAVSHKVASALGAVLAENTNPVFKLTARTAGSHITGEWQVRSFTHEDNVLRMECVATNDSERTLSFDSSIDGESLKDAEVVYTN